MTEQLGKFNKDLGSPLATGAADITQTNADGELVVPLTQEQKYLFDKNGWLLVPGVLTASEIEEMRDFCYRLKHDPETIIPQHHGSTYGGPLEKLTDHPVIVAFGNEFLASPYLASDTCYGFPHGDEFSGAAFYIGRNTFFIPRAQRQRYVADARRLPPILVPSRSSI